MFSRGLVKLIFFESPPVGHTYEDIDGVFSRIWTRMRDVGAITPQDYRRLVTSCVPDYKGFMEAHRQMVEPQQPNEPQYHQMVEPKHDFSSLIMLRLHHLAILRLIRLLRLRHLANSSHFCMKLSSVKWNQNRFPKKLHTFCRGFCPKRLASRFTELSFPSLLWMNPHPQQRDSDCEDIRMAVAAEASGS